MIPQVVGSLWSKSGSKMPMEDTVDYISRYCTSRLLLALFFGLLTFCSFGRPVKCMAPSEYQAAWTEYAERQCYLEGTYYVSLDTELFPDQNERLQNVRNYYQLIPILLLGASIVSLIPSFIWHYCNRYCGLNGDEAVLIALVASEQKYSSRRDGVEAIALSIKVALSEFGSKAGKRLTIFWLATKLATVLINIVLFGIVVEILGSKIILGHDVVFEIMSGTLETEHFPWTVMCDFKVFILGNVADHSIQCSLPANFFNQWIIVLLWFWTLFVIILGFVCFWVDVLLILVPVLRAKKLKKIGSLSEENIDRVKSFASYLKLDGFLVLRFIAKNGSDQVAKEVAKILWDNHMGVSMAVAEIDEEDDL